jgi:homoserine O-succinyltransferase
MPIRLPEDLPAFAVLEAEGVMVMGEDRAARQDIRPLQIALLNLMPEKILTETQFARLIGATPLQIELTLVRMSEHTPRPPRPNIWKASISPSPTSGPASSTG